MNASITLRAVSFLTKYSRSGHGAYSFPKQPARKTPYQQNLSPHNAVKGKRFAHIFHHAYGMEWAKFPFGSRAQS
jgi:hypothetical protein